MPRVNGTPYRPNGLFLQPHACLLWRLVCLAMIALKTSQHAVLPRRTTAVRTRHHVVDRQLVLSRTLVAILTRVAISLEQVASAERNRRRRQLAETGQRNDFRNTDPLRYRLDEWLIAAGLHQRPVFPLVRLIVARVDNLCRLVPYQYQSPRHRSHVNGLSVTIQNNRWSL